MSLQQLHVTAKCVHTSSHADNDGRLPPLAKGFNPQRRCLNPALCCHGNRSGKRAGYKWEVARGQGTHYVWLCDRVAFSILAAGTLSVSCGNTWTSHTFGNHFLKTIPFCWLFMWLRQHFLKSFKFEKPHLVLTIVVGLVFILRAATSSCLHWRTTTMHTHIHT